MERGRALIWLVRDRWGRDIVLYADTWYNHVLPRHRLLTGHEAAVAKVLTSPFRVMHDATDPERECFYRMRVHPQFPDLYLKVCVELTSDRDGLVVTAFLAPTIRSDEVQKWP